MPGSFMPFLGMVASGLMSALLQPKPPKAPSPAPAPPPPAPAPIPAMPEVKKENTIPAEDVQASQQARQAAIKRQSAAALDTNGLENINNTTDQNSNIQFKTLLGS